MKKYSGSRGEKENKINLFKNINIRKGKISKIEKKSKNRTKLKSLYWRFKVRLTGFDLSDGFAKDKFLWF